MQMPAAQRNGTWEIMRDAYNPGDLTVTGDFEGGDLKKVKMMVSKDEAKGTADLIEFEAGGKLMVNGQEAHPPMTTANGTKISMDGGKISIETKGGDHFSMESTVCPAINLEGDVNGNRGTGNVRSQLLGDFDDNPNSTWVTNADANYVLGSGGGSGGGAGGADGVGGAGAATGLSSSIMDSILESLRKVFSSLASSGDAGPAPGPGADFAARVKDPDLKAAILDKAKGGGIDVDKLVASIKDPAERDKALLALTHGSASLEDVLKGIANPEDRMAFLTELVGPAKAKELDAKLFAGATVS